MKARRATMSELETAWFAKLTALSLQFIEGRAAELRAAGLPPDRVEAKLREEAPAMDSWLKARKADIRAILTSSAAGRVPVLADGTSATATKIAANDNATRQ